MDYIKLFSTETERNIFRNSAEYVEPHVSYCDEYEIVKYNKSSENKKSEYLQFMALEDNSTIARSGSNSLSINIEYSVNIPDNWITWDYSEIILNEGEVIYMRGNNPGGLNNSNISILRFNMTGKISASGNIMSLLYYDDFKDKLIIPSQYCFQRLFENCTSLIIAPELPATTLAPSCYYRMFFGCTNLTTAPELPATTLAPKCCREMFYGCTSLTTAPSILPAITLAEGCYYQMFYGCTSLIQTPELPAITLADSCYYRMFRDCTSLVTASELPATTVYPLSYFYMFANCTSLTTVPSILPATTLNTRCYEAMFAKCTSLTTAPALPATTLAERCYKQMFQETAITIAPKLPATTLVTQCYYGMFNSCSNLSYIKAMFTTDPSTSDYTYAWTYNVAESGTFIKNSSAEWNVTGSSGIPEGWTVQDERYTPGIWEDIYLTFDILSNGTINWTYQGVTRTISYKLNNGEWTNITASLAGATINVSTGDKVMFKGNNTTYGGHNEEDGGPIWCGFYGSTASFNIQGNIMSLINGDSFVGVTTLSSERAFLGLFENTNVINAENLVLPATTLAEDCYYSMFAGCTSLINAPKLPATTLANSCYRGMFSNCTSLVDAPELPATTLEYGCYDSMFYGCTSLTIAPELPATTLTSDCYVYMFMGCTSLTTAPELPATTLAWGCYNGMFQNCTSLTQEAVVPSSVTPVSSDYCYYMYFNCSITTPNGNYDQTAYYEEAGD